MLVRSLRTGLRLPLLTFFLCVLPFVVVGCIPSFTLPSRPPTTIDISGVILGSDGLPVAGAQVEINQRTAETASDGTYTLAGVLVPDGRVWYKVSAAEHGTRTGSAAATKGSLLELNVTLPRAHLVGTGTVSGTMNFAAQPALVQSCPAYEDPWSFAHDQVPLWSDIDLTPTEVIVDSVGLPSEALAERLARETGARSYRVSKLIERIILGVPTGMDAQAFADAVRLHPEVVDAHPNSIVVNSSIPPAAYTTPPNDECYMAQHHLPQVQAPWAWTVTTGSRSVVVGVVDSGADPEHPDLSANLIAGWDFIDDTDEMTDLTGHGTHVSGILGAVSNNGIGVVGVAHEVSIMPVRTFRLISGTAEHISAGIRYAVDQGVDIINASFSAATDHPLLREAVEYALSRGVIFVAGVGNSGPSPDTTMYPALYEGVIGVGGLGQDRTRIGAFSARGEGLDLVAPGEEVWSLYLGGGYGTATGTSMSTPIVSGVVALMLANGIPKDQVEEILYRTAVRVGDPETNPEDRATYGWGIVNAYAAVLGLDPMDTVIFVVNRLGAVVGTVTSPDASRQFTITDVPQGDDLSVIGWIDVNGNGWVDMGDYFGISPLSLDEGGAVSVNLMLDVYDQEQPIVYDLAI